MTTQPQPPRPDRTAEDAEPIEREARRDESQRGAAMQPNDDPPGPMPPPEEHTRQ